MNEEKVTIGTEEIRLDQLLKWSGRADSGAQAKELIREGLIRVNGEIETKRGRRLFPGDVVEVAGKTAFRLVRE